jgi:TrmH family RNA methyltransferase
VRTRARSLHEIAGAADLLVVVLDRPSNPANIGAIARSADGLGADALVVIGHAADPYDPASIRASTGSVFARPVIAVPSVADVTSWAAELVPRPRLVGTDEGAIAIAAADLAGPLVVLAGNEGRGLSRAAREACDELVAIPMRGSASSLNVAAATAVVLYEIDRRRRL